MEMRLEDDTVTRVTVPKGRRDVKVFDTQTPGLFLRKFASGRAMYGVSYAVNGTPRRVHIRDAGERGSLAAARKEALDVRAKARLGQDLIAEREAAKAAAAAAALRKVNTVGKVAAEYLAARKKELRPRSYVEVARHIDKNAKTLHGRPIEDITRAEVVALVNDVERDHGKSQADKTRISLATMWAWALDAGHVSGTPFVHIKSRAGNVRRDRVLSPTELRQVWLACDAVDDEGGRLVNESYAKVIKLLILTAQRRAEIGKLAWAEVVQAGNMLRIELPAERTKNDLPHLVHLSTQAIALLPPRPDQTDPDARTTLFGRRRHKGFSGWSKAKGELDEAIAELRRKAGIRQTMKPWRVHDLRRTGATMMGEIGIAEPHIVESIMNHVSGTKAGVAGTYNRAIYWSERITALDSWGAWVEKNVVA
jgi:integrase